MSYTTSVLRLLSPLSARRQCTEYDVNASHVYVSHTVAGRHGFSAPDTQSSARNAALGCVINGTLTSFHHIVSSAADASAATAADTPRRGDRLFHCDRIIAVRAA